MPRPILPPKYINLETNIAFSKLPDGAVRFYAQLRGLAWQSNYKNTPELSMPQLEEITGKRKTAIYGYMTLLRTSTPLRWAATHKGTFIFSFEEQSDSAIPESPNQLLLQHTDQANSDSVVVEDIPQKRKNGKTESEPPMFGDISLMESEQLYSQITGQITFPSSWKEEYRRALADVLTNNFGGDVVKASASGKPVFARYCNTRGKTGTPYTRTGTGWLDWWQAELAPKPEEPALGLSSNLFSTVKPVDGMTAAEILRGGRTS